MVAHALARLLADPAEATGLTGAFCEALAPSRQRVGGHEPGRGAADLAVMPADGSESISDPAALRDQFELFGPVASAATTWRVLHELGDGHEFALAIAGEDRRRRFLAGAARAAVVSGLRHARPRQHRS